MRDDDEGLGLTQRSCVFDDALGNAITHFTARFAVTSGLQISAMPPGIPQRDILSSQVVVAFAFPRTTVGFAQPHVSDYR